MKVRYGLFFCLFLLLATPTIAQNDTTQTNTAAQLAPEIEVKSWVDVKIINEEGEEFLELICSGASVEGKANFKINGEDTDLIFTKSRAVTNFSVEDGQMILIKRGSSYADIQLVHVSENRGTYHVTNIPLWLSIVPPLVAIVLALIFKEVIISLFVGIWAGTIILNGLKFDPISLILALFDVVTGYVVATLTDVGHISVIVFSLMIGGMVAIISRNGGMAGIVLQLSKFAKTNRSTQFVTWLLGVAIFFDDYANSLIVGNTMRAATDKFKISREKLSYIVDSTAAPVSAIAFITTWIGVELGYIKDNFVHLAGLETVPSAYSVFLTSLQYAFYPIFTLGFILMLIYTRREFGPMWAAEHRSRTTGEVGVKRGEATEEADMEDLQPVKGAPLKWYNAFFPVMTVIGMTIIGLLTTGTETSLDALLDAGHNVQSGFGSVWANLHLLRDGENIGFFERLGIIIGNADSYTALIWASLSGLFVSIALTIGGRIMKLYDTMNTMLMGFKTMLPALMILAFAWSLGVMTEELHTATFLTSTLQNSLPPTLMPSVIFILAGAIAFSTGSSWSTMAILYPIAIPATWAICRANGLEVEESLPILYNVIATVLAASVFGDHCSPISDTTILSSLASDCNHIDHVRTQLPYAVTVGGISILMGFLAAVLALPAWVNFLVGFGILFLIVRFIGKPIPKT